MPEVTPLEAHDPTSLGEYALLGRLASGGQGVVYLGRADGGDGQWVAVKVPHERWTTSSAGRSELQKEADAARRVAPFCTAAVLHVELGEDRQYVVSEFVDGPSLARAVTETGPLTGAALDRLAISTATALVAIHRAGVVHRDVKPGNIVLGPDGPRVIDFGIARDSGADTTTTASLRGTPAYLAPEQFEGRRATAASDVFAWAATMAFAATGRAAFAGPTVAAVMARAAAADADLDGVPQPLVGLLRRCLVVDPGERPSAEQVLDSLLGRSAPGPTQVPGSGGSPGRRRAVWGLSGLVLAVVAGGAALRGWPGAGTGPGIGPATAPSPTAAPSVMSPGPASASPAASPAASPSSSGGRRPAATSSAAARSAPRTTTGGPGPTDLPHKVVELWTPMTGR